MLAGLLLATGWAPPGGSKFNGDNMNGEYLLSRTPHAPAGRSFTTRFRRATLADVRRAARC